MQSLYGWKVEASVEHVKTKGNVIPQSYSCGSKTVTPFSAQVSVLNFSQYITWYTVHCTVNTMQYAVYTIQHKGCTLHCTLCR